MIELERGVMMRPALAVQLTTHYSGAVDAKAKDPNGAQRFIELLASPEAAQAIENAGLAPN